MQWQSKYHSPKKEVKEFFVKLSILVIIGFPEKLFDAVLPTQTEYSNTVLQYACKNSWLQKYFVKTIYSIHIFTVFIEFILAKLFRQIKQ